MQVYSKIEEKLLSLISFQIDPEHGFRWEDIWHTYLQTYSDLFVSADHIFNRGLDLEELTLVMTGDAEKAWSIAEPYYDAASRKGHAKAFYRLAVHWGESNHSEFIYAHYLEGAAKRGYMPAVRDFIKYYDEFKVKTITRNVWRRKRRQEKIFFKCCEQLAEQKDPNAMWKLGTCYLLGKGVKKDASRGLVIRDCAIEMWDLDEEAKANLISIQNSYKEDGHNR